MYIVYPFVGIIRIGRGNLNWKSYFHHAVRFEIKQKKTDYFLKAVN